MLVGNDIYPFSLTGTRTTYDTLREISRGFLFWNFKILIVREIFWRIQPMNQGKICTWWVLIQKMLQTNQSKSPYLFSYISSWLDFYLLGSCFACICQILLSCSLLFKSFNVLWRHVDTIFLVWRHSCTSLSYVIGASVAA